MKLVILDANVIICLFELQLFDALIKRYSILIPTTIKNESKYYTGKDQEEVEIDWGAYLDAGKIKEVSASSSALQSLTDKFKADFSRGIDPGELEAIAIVCDSDDDNIYFCTGDLPALKAMGILGKGSQALSLEIVLKESGMARTLKQHFTEKRKEQEISKAFAEKDIYLQ